MARQTSLIVHESFLVLVFGKEQQALLFAKRSKNSLSMRARAGMLIPITWLRRK
jgi:hypothetical protein